MKDNTYKIVEIFLVTLLGLIFGALAGLYFWPVENSLLITFIASALGAISFPSAAILVQNSKNKILKIAMTVLSICIFLVCILGILFLTVDTSRFSPHQKLYLTKNVKLRELPGKYDNEKTTVLMAGSEVYYLSSSIRRFWISRKMLSGEWKHYFDFWREVKLKDGKRGWVYGAYLSSTSRN